MLTLVRMILFKILSRICEYFYFLVAEYPWQAAILQKDEFDNIYTCGATLIDSSHLLTASHCVNKFRLTLIFFRKKTTVLAEKVFHLAASGAQLTAPCHMLSLFYQTDFFNLTLKLS